MSSIANFAQSFPLNRSRLKLTIEAIAQNPSAMSRDIASYAGFNTPVAEGFVGWARHTGLIRATDKGNELTPIGRLVQDYDSFLIDPNTLWVLHYFLCSEHEERSEAWYLFANEYAVPGLETSAEQFRSFYEQGTLNKRISKSAFDKDTGLLLNCYTNSEALGNLNIMRSTGSKNRYEIWKPSLADIHIRAFGLFDFWKRNRPETDTIPLDQIVSMPGNIGKVFLMSVDEVQKTVNELASLGLLTYSDTQHRPVNRIFKMQAYTLLEKYYKGV